MLRLSENNKTVLSAGCNVITKPACVNALGALARITKVKCRKVVIVVGVDVDIVVASHHHHGFCCSFIRCSLSAVATL